MKYVGPSVRETAFNCPYCGALTTQFWHSVQAVEKKDESLTPIIVEANDEREFKFIEDAVLRHRMLSWRKKMQRGLPYLETNDKGVYTSLTVNNIHISKCYNCSELAVWVYKKMLFPVAGSAPAANPDLPAEIRTDYDEASSILDLSPRGAAALVRLCIQKLCKHLGKPGENINSDIAALVKDGLDVRVQKALDAVRVIGNSAVHPGKIDLRDDRATAESLFRLLNLIADKMITEPKHVDDVYDMLPPGAKAQIEARDKS